MLACAFLHSDSDMQEFSGIRKDILLNGVSSECLLACLLLQLLSPIYLSPLHTHTVV